MMPIVCANIWLGSASIGMSLLANEGKAMGEILMMSFVSRRWRTLVQLIQY
jgi:hypothetical protein